MPTTTAARPALTTAEAAEQIAGYIQCVGTAALATALREGVDLERIIRAELASRGVDLAGRWVGFPAAKALHGT